MRQLSAPGRCAVWLVTALAAATTAGCVSVGDGGGAAAPSKGPQPRGADAEPDGGGALPGGGGRSRTGMGGTAHSEGAGHGHEGRDAGADGGPSASATESAARPPAAGSRGGSGVVLPQPAGPQGPTGAPPGRSDPPADPTHPAGEPTTPAEPTPPATDPEPTEQPPTDPPTETPAAEPQLGELRESSAAWSDGPYADPYADLEGTSRPSGG
ncbi:hypothetical protein [Streptomyces sp. NPDC127084]|uniref:hypothetical protein n=1 Tax=Streptomyces sp. NPDC127084 TaxID=3347133 RepID=UPI0036611F82